MKRIFFILLFIIGLSLQSVLAQEATDISHLFTEQKARVSSRQSPSLQITPIPSVETSDALPTTGEWKGKAIKIIPIDRFFPETDHFIPEGIKSLTTLKDGRIIGGGKDAFFIKFSADVAWKNLQLVEIPNSFDLDGIRFIRIAETNTSSDIYLDGDLGLVKLDKNYFLSEIEDPFDSSGHLKDFKDMAVGNRALAAFKNGNYGYTNGALYFIHKNILRKWLLPRPDPSRNSDSILGIFHDVSANNSLYIIVGCEAYGGICPFSDLAKQYLVRLQFSANTQVPLSATRLTKVSIPEFVSGQYIYKPRIKLNPDGKKTLYSILKTPQQKDRLAVIYDFKPNSPLLELHLYSIPSPSESVEAILDFVLDSDPNTDIVYAVTSGPSALWAISDLKPNIVPSIESIAEVNTQSLTMDSSKNIILGFGPSPPNTAAITIWSTVANPITPTSTNVSLQEIQINENALGFKIPTFSQFLTFAIRGFFVLAGLLALLFLLLGWLAWIVSGGNKESVEKARDKIVAALIGVIIMVAVLSLVVALEQVVFKQSICFGISCPITLPDLLKPSN